MRVTIANPRSWGSKRMSRTRAANLVRRGKAVWLPDGRLQITDQERIRFADMEVRRALSEETREEASEFARNRGGVLFWNGARARYVDGRDISMFPPGCNVAFPKIGTLRAARRYA